MGSQFPGFGNTYLVDFVAFRVELVFSLQSSLLYTVIGRDGTRGASETVTVKSEDIVDDIFLVTWQEADKTTVVHIENFNQKTIVTNITNPDLTFEQYHGTFLKS